AGRVRILAAIDDPSVARKILDYLGLPSRPPRLLPLAETDTSKSPNDGQAGCLRRRVPLSHPPLRSGAKISFFEFLCAPKNTRKRPCAPEDGIRKMASLTARNRLFHDIVPDFRDRPAMENRVRFSYALTKRAARLAALLKTRLV